MSCCCLKTYKLCDINPCGDVLELPIPVALAGVHTLELDFLGKVLTTTAHQPVGDTMTFQLAELNENFTFTGQVRDPAGEIVTFTIDEVEYNCIQFTTKRELSWNTSQGSPSS